MSHPSKKLFDPRGLLGLLALACGIAGWILLMVSGSDLNLLKLYGPWVLFIVALFLNLLGYVTGKSNLYVIALGFLVSYESLVTNQMGTHTYGVKALKEQQAGFILLFVAGILSVAVYPFKPPKVKGDIFNLFALAAIACQIVGVIFLWIKVGAGNVSILPLLNIYMTMFFYLGAYNGVYNHQIITLFFGAGLFGTLLSQVVLGGGGLIITGLILGLVGTGLMIALTAFLQAQSGSEAETTPLLA